MLYVCKIYIYGKHGMYFTYLPHTLLPAISENMYYSNALY